MDNTPIQMNGSAAAGRHVGAQSNETNRHNKKKNKLKTIIISGGVVLAIAILSFVSIFLYQSTTNANIDGGKYQAVFLSNGQVYFGKLHTLNSGYMKLTDIFYLQTKTAVSSTNPQSTSDSSSTDVQLIKLGSEIHGPNDEMVISKDQVLFFENLKSDGKVAQSITEYQTKNK
jgi:hypothetical protein